MSVLITILLAVIITQAFRIRRLKKKLSSEILPMNSVGNGTG